MAFHPHATHASSIPGAAPLRATPPLCAPESLGRLPSLPGRNRAAPPRHSAAQKRFRFPWPTRESEEDHKGVPWPRVSKGFGLLPVRLQLPGSPAPPAAEGSSIPAKQLSMHSFLEPERLSDSLASWGFFHRKPLMDTTNSDSFPSRLFYWDIYIHTRSDMSIPGEDEAKVGQGH